MWVFVATDYLNERTSSPGIDAIIQKRAPQEIARLCVDVLNATKDLASVYGALVVVAAFHRQGPASLRQLFLEYQVYQLILRLYWRGEWRVHDQVLVGHRCWEALIQQ